jgi:uncharacterized protein
MRSAIFSVVFIALACGTAAAQQDPSASHVQAAEELLTIQKVEEQITNQFAQMTGQLGAMGGNNPMAKVMEDFFAEFLPWSKLQPEYVRIYTELFSEAELRELIALFRTPAGQRFVEATPAMTAEMMETTQRLMAPHMGELQQRIMRAMGGGQTP